jgi:hypothetical protein
MAALKTPDHHGSHTGLLRTPRSAPRGKVDAIIVPTIRRPKALDVAADLAEALDCTLVTLHSGRYTSAASTAEWLGWDVDLLAIDMPDRLPGLAPFRTSQMLAAKRIDRRADTSAKRNLGLLLAHTIGWKRIVFLDDDITVPDPADLERAVGLLDSYNAVGLFNEGYPDNSVVCHAFRLVDGQQDSFIGGGALAVEIDRNQSFFPDIYNEDWFYLLDPVKGVQPLAAAGTAIQSDYDPFRDERRARNEEFGDVMAEGIFWLLDQGRSLTAADGAHWRDFLLRRRRFIESILDRLDRIDATASECERIAAALRASLGRLALIDAALCERYVREWIKDRQAWDRELTSLHQGQPADQAVRYLSRKYRGQISCVRHSAAERPRGSASRLLAGAGRGSPR